MSPLQGVLIVVEAVVASVLLPPMAWLLAKTYRRSAAGRRLVWVTAFAMLLGLPLLAVIAPSLTLIALPASAPLPAAPPVAAVAAVVSAPDPDPSGLGWFVLIPVAIAVWLAGLAKLGAEHLVALARLELMRRRATPWRMPTPVPVRGCALLMSEDCPGPMTWGVVRPVIMLPDQALAWPADRLATVLRHEMAHVRRRDGLAQALAVIACALYWPNPLVWGAARALRREAELAADDAVIAAGVLPSDYAGQLLELAAEWRARRLTPTGLAMAAPPALSQRVQSILSTDAIRTGATAMDTLKLVLLGGAATAALTLARPSLAEVTPTASEQRPAPPAAEAKPAPGTPIRVQVGNRVVEAVQGPGDKQGANTNIQLAQQDVPAPPAAPAPPAVALAPLPPLPAAPPSAIAVQGSPEGIAVQTPFGGQVFNLRTMTPEQRAELDRQLAQIAPAVNKAIADAHIDETVQKALASQDPKTRELVAKQLADLGPTIQRAVAAAHIQELVQQRLAQLGPQIQEATKKARAQAADAEDRAAATLEEEAKRARERAKRDGESQASPIPAPASFITGGTVPYNQTTDDPASPTYIGPGQPGAQHPVPAELAKKLNARNALAGVPGANRSWTLSWLPNPNGPQPSRGDTVDQSKN